MFADLFGNVLKVRFDKGLKLGEKREVRHLRAGGVRGFQQEHHSDLAELVNNEIVANTLLANKHPKNIDWGVIIREIFWSNQKSRSRRPVEGK